MKQAEAERERTALVVRWVVHGSCVSRTWVVSCFDDDDVS